MFINSDPPVFRKARAVAVEVASFEYALPKTSYIDTTKLEHFPDNRAHLAFADIAAHRASISPSLRLRICAAARSHNTLTADELACFIS